MAAGKPPGMWVGQTLHVSCLVVLLTVTGVLWHTIGAAEPLLFWTAVAVPVLHQTGVWICWRRALGSTQPPSTKVFRLYLVGFFVLFGGRFVSLLVLAWADAGSLQLPVWLRLTLTTALLIPGAYAMFSVVKWFGFARAAGADHFEERYRQMPLVREGIFRYTSNGMYVFAFFLFWAIAVGFDSRAALIVTAFSHAYIWVHYHATEKPDMRYLYGEVSAPTI